MSSHRRSAIIIPMSIEGVRRNFWMSSAYTYTMTLLGKPQIFPEQGLEQAKKNYLSFILGTNN